jgi:hypothetical protein
MSLYLMSITTLKIHNNNNKLIVVSNNIPVIGFISDDKDKKKIVN